MPLFIVPIACLVIPIVLIILCQRIKVLDKLGTVVLAVITGIALASLLDFPSLFDASKLEALQTDLSGIAVALALPLLVFSIDVKHSLSMAGDTMKSMGVALLAVMLVSAAGAVLFNDHLDHIWQIAGMSVGAYTGGGPNMAAIKTAIDAEESVFLTMITYDILLSAIYLVFVMTIAKPIFSLFLKPFVSKGHSQEDADKYAHMADESADSYKVLANTSTMLDTLQALLISGVIVGISVAVSQLFPQEMSSAATIISLSSLGVAASFVPCIRQLANSFQLGMFLILVFGFTMGTMTDTSIITNIDVNLFAYILFILLGSLILQAVICKLLKIDVDTFLITSSAAIMSVPFIPVIAGALKNREIIIPGFAAAIIGYILGNYLGVMMAYATRWLVGA